MKALLILAITFTAVPSLAQQTTGSIVGRVVDEQDAGIPGVVVSARSSETGFSREGTTDQNGVYRLAALPVGAYDVSASRTGLTRFEHSGIVVNVSKVTDLDIVLRPAPLTETVVVTGDAPLVPTTSSTVGEVVDTSRIESLPLNGRQFANLAAIVPGVGIGFHPDLTKSTQYAPQIGGGGGRNVYYVVDGGDNNDDTVGGLLQLYPLEAIAEFNVMTQRFDAEYGRGGAVLNVVTKAGTNQTRGSWFTMLRDDALNARTFTEQIMRVPKQAYQRYQFGGSVGGPLMLDKAHYFAAYERTQQDTKQAVNTLGLFPNEDGIYDIPFRENLFTLKVSSTPRLGQYLALRYAADTNSQPTGASLRAAPSSWASSSNGYHSFNVNHNWVVGGSALNEVVVQRASFINEIPATTPGPHLRFPNGVVAGASPVAPQGTEQTKWHVREDFSWSRTGWGGLGHDFKAGINWIHEPHLFTSVGGGTNGIFIMGAPDVNGPVTSVTVIGGNTAFNVPLDSYALYVRDNWRFSPRLTLNLGLRWDYTDGIPIDQNRSPNFLALQAAGSTGRFAGTVLEDFGSEPRADMDNIQPRLGFAYNVDGAGRQVIHGGWGVYTDFAYTNANILTAAIDAFGGAGPTFMAVNPAGIRRPDGSFFHATDPLSIIASQNLVNPNSPALAGEVVSPLLEQPFTYESNLGWAFQIGRDDALSVDYVRVEGRDLNLRIRPNTLVNGQRFLAGLPIQPAGNGFRVAISKGESQYDALITSYRRRLSGGFDLSGSYTLSKATGDTGSASDDIAQNIIQDIRDPFGSVQDGPFTRTDARHRVTISAIVEAPWDIRVAPIFMYRSALPVHTFEGLDLNADSIANDKTASAYRFTGLNDDGTATFKEAGVCQTVNCSRRAPFSQLNLRISRGFNLWSGARVEAIAEVFNLFNAKNPSIPATSQRRSAAGAPLPSFMQPTAFAGDFQQPEQRVGQIGFRITF